MRRNTFLKAGSVGILGSCMPFTLPAQSSEIDPLDPVIVKDFVGAGHGRFERVQELLEEFPNLIYSRHDWGNGDFEEALEAAGHVGNREIAEYLIDKGARVNLFVLTMLGETDLVKPVLERYPNLVHALGAHGFTLLHHAHVGGTPSEELYAYLESKGLKDMKINIK